MGVTRGDVSQSTLETAQLPPGGEVIPSLRFTQLQFCLRRKGRVDPSFSASLLNLRVLCGQKGLRLCPLAILNERQTRARPGGQGRAVCGVLGRDRPPVEERSRVAGPCIRLQLVTVGFQGLKAPPTGGRRARGLL